MKNLLFLLFLPLLSFSQQNSFHKELFESYETYKEDSLKIRRFKHSDIQPLIERIGSEKDFKVRVLGKSIEGRDISMISVGTGATNVLLWSQMHGDESTATMAIFDILNYIKRNKKILNHLSVHFIPMLNPDGAEKFTRRNSIGIDINRDALRLQSPESKILKAARDSLDADFGFNLHDQSKYYNAEKTEKPATISYLAPAYDYDKNINTTRANAMRIIAKMNEIIQYHAPGQVGRYSDDFEPRAFGDNIQKWGTSTVLIESGGFKNDPEKQFIRKLNFVSILAAIHSISTGSYKNISIDSYSSIPKNDRKLFDLKITQVTFPFMGKDFTVDLGINLIEKENKEHTDFYTIGRIADLGDLSTYYGYKTLIASDLTFKLGETYPKILNNIEDLKGLYFEDLIRQGYTKLAFASVPDGLNYSKIPMEVIGVKDIQITRDHNIPKPPLQLGKNPSFLLTKDGKIHYALINGHLYDLREDQN